MGCSKGRRIDVGLIVVVGPPCGGKTTYARQHAQPGDIIVDWDALACALAAPDADPYDHGHAVRQCAFRARASAINEALKHAGDVDVYLIHTAPRPEALEAYARQGGRVVVVDPGMEVVVARCQAERPASALAVAMRWYDDHHHSEFKIAKTSRSW